MYDWGTGAAPFEEHGCVKIAARRLMEQAGRVARGADSRFAAE
ncbi:MAG: hypothetical protein ACOYOU_20455 [Kiritimatiellia bacterium]